MPNAGDSGAGGCVRRDLEARSRRRRSMAVVRLMRYTAALIDELDIADVGELDGALSPEAVCWIDIEGFGDEQVLRAMAERCAIHLRVEL